MVKLSLTIACVKCVRISWVRSRNAAKGEHPENLYLMSGLSPSIALRLVNGSTGDPALFVDYPGRDDAILFDAGENCSLDPKTLGDLRVVFLSHHHVDHFIGFDRIVRANLDRDKALSSMGRKGRFAKFMERSRATTTSSSRSRRL